MDNKRITSGKAMSIPAGLGIGAITSLGVTVISAALMAKLLDSEMLSFEHVGYGIMVLLLISSFSGAKIAYSKVKRRKAMVCILSGILFIGLLLSITALFFGGQYDAVGVTSGLVMAGSTSAGLTGFQRKGQGSTRKRKRRHC